MMSARCGMILALLTWFGTGTVEAQVAQGDPSYAREVRPFLAKYCLECHNAEKAKGDLVMEDFKGLMAGGKHGPVVIVDKPDESLLVLLPEGKAKPPMPPKQARQPSRGEVSVLRRWVAAGAGDDTASVRIALPNIKPRGRPAPPVTALAYDPSGKILAIGARRELVFIDVAGGEAVARPPLQAGKVTALAYDRKGTRLAVANSSPAAAGVVYLHPLTSGLPVKGSEIALKGHKDAIYSVVFSPDGKLLATTGYDRLIKLWDVPTGKEVRTLKDHSDAVYGLAFSPDGRLLASAGADRALKIWDVASGRRLYTLGESTDWLYAVAWSPDGKHVAAGGVDKSIRVWEATAAGGRIVGSVFAHEAPILRLDYAANGKTLYSLAEDRRVKAWDAARLVERKVYPQQAEAVLTFAVRPDHGQLALGRYDGKVLLLDSDSGSVRAEPFPIKPRPPELVKLSPDVGQRGRALSLKIEGKYLDSPTELVIDHPGVQSQLLAQGNLPTSVHARVTFPDQARAGVYKLALKTAAGQSNFLPFTLDLFPLAAEAGPNDSRKTAQKLTLPASVAATISQAGQVDFFAFEALERQEIGAQVVAAALGSKLEPVLRLTDPSGQRVAEGHNGLLGHRCAKAGKYVLSVHDREYRGGSDWRYRLHVGDIPIVTSVFPLGLQRGAEATFDLQSVNVFGPSTLSHRVMAKAPSSAAIGSRLALPVTTPKGAPLGELSVIVGEFSELVSARFSPGSMPAAKQCLLSVPGTANGIISEAGRTETWRFPAKKSQRLVVEVNAHRIGSPLDSYIEILDSKDRPVPWVTLRAVAKTYVTFRDHDSSGPGIRIETWNELAMNDFLWVGQELLRINELPKNPDDDCRFDSEGNQRVGYFGTTPAYLPLGIPMYKVTIHSPGTQFPPNGFPVISLNYRNDDGGPGFDKDSRLLFDPPADGEYQVRIGDSRGRGGPNYAYRLTVRPPRPDFTISFKPTAPAVWKGGAVPVVVTAARSDGFDGPIAVRVENLPTGFSAPATTIPAGENDTAFALWADPTAQAPTKGSPLQIVGTAMIHGKEVIRQATGGRPRVVNPGDLATTTDRAEVTVKPGQQVWLTAKIERRNNFKGRVPLDVRGLPHGVRVLDIGLNGILITDKESSRAFAIYAEPWVQPTAQPFVVLARHEGKDSEYAAKSVLLKVSK